MIRRNFIITTSLSTAKLTYVFDIVLFVDSMPLRTLLVGIEAEKSDVDRAKNLLESSSLFDYDIVIVDVDSVFPEQWREEIPLDENMGVQRKTGRSFRNTIEKLSKEATLLLEKGGMLACLMRPNRGITWTWHSRTKRRDVRERAHNYDWIPIESLHYVIEYGSGRRKKLCDDPGPFARYLKMPETYWTAYFENVDRLKVQSRSLALNDAGKPIAVEVSIGKGSIVFLPLSEHPNVGDILIECTSRSFKRIMERPPPSWMEKIRVPSEDADRESLNALLEKVSKVQAEYETALNVFEEKTRVKKLLYEKDEPLEEAVKEAFKELGFTLTRKDDKDWIASSDYGEAILEVTGSVGSIDIDKLRQLLNYLIDDYKESGVEKKAILVGNHFVNDTAEARKEPFTEKVLGEADVHKMCLLPTVELFKIICYLREGKVKADDIRKKIVETVGIFELA